MQGLYNNQTFQVGTRSDTTFTVAAAGNSYQNGIQVPTRQAPDSKGPRAKGGSVTGKDENDNSLETPRKHHEMKQFDLTNVRVRAYIDKTTGQWVDVDSSENLPSPTLNELESSTRKFTFSADIATSTAPIHSPTTRKGMPTRPDVIIDCTNSKGRNEVFQPVQKIHTETVSSVHALSLSDETSTPSKSSMLSSEFERE